MGDRCQARSLAGLQGRRFGGAGLVVGSNGCDPRWLPAGHTGTYLEKESGMVAGGGVCGHGGHGRKAEAKGVLSPLTYPPLRESIVFPID